MGGWVDGWMDGYILTVHSVPISKFDPGTPPAGLGGCCAANICMADPTRVHCTQGPMD